MVDVSNSCLSSSRLSTLADREEEEGYSLEIMRASIPAKGSATSVSLPMDGPALSDD